MAYIIASHRNDQSKSMKQNSFTPNMNGFLDHSLKYNWKISPYNANQ